MTSEIPFNIYLLTLNAMQMKIISHLPVHFYNNNNNKKFMFLSKLYNMLITKRKKV